MDYPKFFFIQDGQDQRVDRYLIKDLLDKLKSIPKKLKIVPINIFFNYILDKIALTLIILNLSLS